MARVPVTDPAAFPAYWAGLVNAGLIDELVGLYHEGAVLMPTFSPHSARNADDHRAYFAQLASREALSVELYEATLDCAPAGDGADVVSGIYAFRFRVDGTLLTFPSRFTFVLDLRLERPILHHHSSQIPRTLT